jgi:folate-binding protein YgfZ
MIVFPLPGAVVLSISGRHAERYLQARLSNDVKTATPQRAIIAGALSPQGKTELLLTLLRTDSTSFLALVDGGDPDTLTTNLGRFKVAEHLEIKDISPSHRVLHICGADAAAWLERELNAGVPRDVELGTTRLPGEALVLIIARQRTLELGFDLVAPAELIARLEAEALKAGAYAPSHREIDALRIEAGILAFPDDVNDGVILAEAAMPATVSFTKGCYVGQEVIAKIDSLGKPPRRFIRLAIPGEHTIPVGAAVGALDGAERPRGKVTSSAFHARRGATVLWVLLKNDGTPPAERYLVEGITATPLE